MRILFDYCVSKKMWDNLRKIDNNIILLKLNNKYSACSDRSIMEFCKKIILLF
jgi:hypothetical protein